MNDLAQRDARCVWHPYTQHGLGEAPLPVISAKGAYLCGEDGQRYLDTISSWWVNVHGHGRSEIAEAISRQALTLDHVHFAGVTHSPAVELAERLVRLSGMGEGTRVFFSDDGSTAVESALKICHQYWANLGEKRPRVLVFRGGYHGDTVGAMSGGETSGFFDSFRSWLFAVDAVDPPLTWWGKATEEGEAAALDSLRTLLQDTSSQICALLLEPLVQGAGGMRFHTPRFLTEVCRVVQECGIPVVFDEVMTGFYRTGSLFAFMQTPILPDLLCLSKALTGGVLPLGATLVRRKFFEAFLGDDFSRALAHGHSFSGNPIACAAALASLDLFAAEDGQRRVDDLSRSLTVRLHELANRHGLERPRAMGGIAAFGIPDCSSSYSQAGGRALSDFALRKGVIIRPLGNVVYLMPPYCVTEQDLDLAFGVLDQYFSLHGRKSG